MLPDGMTAGNPAPDVRAAGNNLPNVRAAGNGLPDEMIAGSPVPDVRAARNPLPNARAASVDRETCLRMRRRILSSSRSTSGSSSNASSNDGGNYGSGSNDSGNYGSNDESNGFQLSFSRSETEMLVKAIDSYETSLRPSNATEKPNDLTFISRDGESGGCSASKLSMVRDAALEGFVSVTRKECERGKPEAKSEANSNENRWKKRKSKDSRHQIRVTTSGNATSEPEGEEVEEWEEEEDMGKEEEEVEFMDIHPDVRGKVFAFLPIKDLGRLAQVSKSLSQEICHPRLWRHLTITKKLRDNAAQVAEREGSSVAEVLLSRTRDLHSIKLLGGVDLNEAWMTSLTRFHATLTHLTLHATLTHAALDDSLMYLAICCPQLTNFKFVDKTIGRIPKFTALGFRSAVFAMHKLKDLAVHISNWIDTAVCDELLLSLTPKHINRVCLEDQRSELTIAAITTLSGFKFLAHLELRRCVLDESSVATIRQMANLESLSLLFVRGWQLTNWLQLLAPAAADGAGISSLRRLEIPVYLGDGALSLLPVACGEKLEKLVLHGIELFNDFRTCFCENVENRLNYIFRKPTNDGMFAVLEGCPRLEHLGILMNNASKDYCNIDFNFASAEYLDRRIECRLKEFHFEHAEDRTSPIFIPIRSTRDGARPEMKYSSNFMVHLIQNLAKTFGNSLERLKMKEVRSNIIQAQSHEGWVSLERLLESLQHLNKLSYLDLSGLDIRMRTSAAIKQQQRHSNSSSFSSPLPPRDSPAAASTTAAGGGGVRTPDAVAAAAAGVRMPDAAATMTATIASRKSYASTAASRNSAAVAYRELMRWKLKNGTLSQVEISNCNIQIIMDLNPMMEKLKEMLNSRAMILIDELNSYHIAYNDSLEDDLETELIFGRDAVEGPRRLIQNEDEDWDIFALIN